MANNTLITKNAYFESQAWAEQHTVIGIDEAGRGCLAGPVVVGAVMLPINASNPLLRDSKVMTSSQREKAFAWIQEHALWATAEADHRMIDNINIYQATLATMQQALINLLEQAPLQLVPPRYVLVDSMPLKLSPHAQLTKTSCHYFDYGESRSPSIAAASIVAKVTRDRLMVIASETFPVYNFAKHKGYGTKEHIAAIKAYGPCSIHRTTFIKKFVEPIDEHPKQTTFFC
jgi:ribonuclease HII